MYQVFKRGGVEGYSVIKHIEGAHAPLRKMVQSVCESPVRVRSGSMEVKGLHSWKLKEWLTALGF